MDFDKETERIDKLVTPSSSSENSSSMPVGSSPVDNGIDKGK